MSDSISHLRAELGWSNAKRVLAAARALLQSEDPAAWEVLVATEMTWSPALKRQVREIADEALAKLLRRGELATVSAEAALALIERARRSRGPEGVALLRALLGHAKAEVSRQAAGALATRRIDAVDDAERRLRAFVRRDLASLRDDRSAFDLLVVRLGADDPQDRRFAAEAVAGAAGKDETREEAWQAVRAAGRGREVAVKLASEAARVAALWAVSRVSNELEKRLEVRYPGRWLLHAEDPERDVERVRHPVVEAVRHAGFRAQFAAGDDAALQAAALVCAAGTPAAHHAGERWEVWERGFGLHGSDGERLVVYRECR